MPFSGYHDNPSVMKMKTISEFYIYLLAISAAILRGGSKSVPPAFRWRLVSTLVGSSFSPTILASSANRIVETLTS